MEEKMKKRATCHNARFGRNGVFIPKHNDRKFEYEKSEHIHAEMTSKNLAYINPELDTLVIEGPGTFEDIEKVVYELLFSDYVKHRNERYIRQRHPERCGTVDDLRRSRYYAPQETIYQIGRGEDSIKPTMLSDIIMETNSRMSAEFPNLKNYYLMLDVAIHSDETSVHAHLRQVWFYRDKYNDLRPGQDKALERLGIPLPDPSREKGRYNNRKMTFDKIFRENYLTVCKEYGINIEEEPVMGVYHKEKEDFIRGELEKKQKEIQVIKERLSDIDCEEQTEKIHLECVQDQITEAYNELRDAQNKAKDLINNAGIEAKSIIENALQVAEDVRQESEKQKKKMLEETNRIMQRIKNQIDRKGEDKVAQFSMQLDAIVKVLSESELTLDNGKKVRAIDYYKPFIEETMEDNSWSMIYPEERCQSYMIPEEFVPDGFLEDIER